MLGQIVLAGVQFCVFVFFGHRTERVLWTMSRAARALFTLFITFGVLCLLLLDGTVIPNLTPTAHIELHIAIDVLLSLVLIPGIFSEASTVDSHSYISPTNGSQWLYLKHVYGNRFLPTVRLTISGALLSIAQTLCAAM